MGTKPQSAQSVATKRQSYGSNSNSFASPASQGGLLGGKKLTSSEAKGTSSSVGPKGSNLPKAASDIAPPPPSQGPHKSPSIKCNDIAQKTIISKHTSEDQVTAGREKRSQGLMGSLRGINLDQESSPCSKPEPVSDSDITPITLSTSPELEDDVYVPSYAAKKKAKTRNKKKKTKAYITPFAKADWVDAPLKERNGELVDDSLADICDALGDFGLNPSEYGL